jgi:hypothetical protein
MQKCPAKAGPLGEHHGTADCTCRKTTHIKDPKTVFFQTGYTHTDLFGLCLGVFQ